MKNLKYFALSLMTFTLIHCSQKKDNIVEDEEITDTVVLTEFEKSVQISREKVPVPRFDDPEIQNFVENYDQFMNQAYSMYDNYAPGSQESMNKMQEYLDDSEKYQDKMKDVLQKADEKDVQRLQTYMLEKAEEMNAFGEKIVNEQLK